MYSVELLQTVLASFGLYTKSIDGRFGEGTAKGVKQLLPRLPAKLLGLDIKDERIGIAVIQLLLKNDYYLGTIDGYWGTLTDSAIVEWKHVQAYGKRLGMNREPELLSVPQRKDILSESEKIKLFGEPGPNLEARLVLIKLPYQFVLGWNRAVTVDTIRVHPLISDRQLAVYEKVFSEYGLKRIHELGLNIWDGTYAHRRVRMGKAWSSHAFGTATDHLASENTLTESFKQARFSRPEYAEWLAIWREYGFLNLGEVLDYDAMHFEIRKGIINA